MPSKAQRAASRQARLSRRRRRGKGAPQNFQAGPTQPAPASETSIRTRTGPARQASPLGVAPATPSMSDSRPSPRPRRRATDTGTAHAGRYLGQELRQIGMITSLIAVIIVGLTFVLG